MTKPVTGRPADLTITQVLTHTSGIGEATGPAVRQARTLADLVPLWLSAPMQYEPGERWRYTQSGINAAGRIVEVVSGLSFDAFTRQRISDPRGDGRQLLCRPGIMRQSPKMAATNLSQNPVPVPEIPHRRP